MQMIINQKQIKDIGWSWVSAKTFFLNEMIQIPLENHFYANKSSKEKSIKYMFNIKYTPLPLRSCVILNEIRKNWPTLQSNRLFEMNKNAGGKSLMELLFFKCAKSNQMYTWAAHRSTKCTGYNPTKHNRHNPTKYAGYN